MFYFFSDDIRDQISSLKKEYQKDKRAKDAAITQTENKSEAADEKAKNEPANKMFQHYLSEQRKYADRKRGKPKKKDVAHEQHTLDLLARFKSKMNQIMYASSDEDDGDGNSDLKSVKKSSATADGAVHAVRSITSDNEDDIAGDDWLSHTLRFEEKAPVLAKDASTKKDDWYDAFDPRNPLNKRKRGGDEKGGSSSSRHQRRGGEGTSSKRSSGGGGGGGSSSGRR